MSQSPESPNAADTVHDYDLIVIGAGGAGLAAAVSAAEEGLDVIIFESEGEVGGSTQLSAGMVTAADTAVQAELGVEDSAARMYQHYMDLNSWQVLPGPTRMFCDESAALVDWLRELGVQIPGKVSHSAHEPGLCRAGVEDVWRGHVPKDQGYGLVLTLDRARRGHKIDVVFNTRVQQLLIDPADASIDGSGSRVRGVIADDVEVTAPAVVVASGGLAQNPALVEKYFPDAKIAGDSLFVVAAPGSRGDHLAMAERNDLAVFGDGWGLLLVTADFQRFHHWQSGFPPPSRVYLNRQGHRFMDEDAPYAISPGLLKRQGGWCWSVFDENARLGLPTGYADWDADRITEEVANGRVHRADTLAELAAAIGADPDVVAASVDRWNTQLTAGHDRDQLRHESLAAKGSYTCLAPIERGPFYAVKMVPGELVCTHTGLQIDDRARVIDTTGRTVSGLYAAGEAAGGILGERYVGGGNSIAHALVLGRKAGRTAAEQLRATAPRGQREPA